MTQVKASPLFILLSLQVLRAAALSEAKLPFVFVFFFVSGLSETQRDRALSFFFDRLTLLGGDLRGEQSGRLP